MSTSPAYRRGRPARIQARRAARLTAPVPGEYSEELAPYTLLRNGGTAGNWRPETPVKDRPDYMPVRLSDGQPGYIKRTDVDHGIYTPLSLAKGPHILSNEAKEEMIRHQRELEARANSKGEVWGDVYADDGTTIIGQMIVARIEPSASSPRE